MVKVVVYTRPRCTACRRAVRFLDDHAVAFEDVEVRTGSQAVPVIEVDRTMLAGFDRERLCRLLALDDDAVMAAVAAHWPGLPADDRLVLVARFRRAVA